MFPKKILLCRILNQIPLSSIEFKIQVWYTKKRNATYVLKFGDAKNFEHDNTSC